LSNNNFPRQVKIDEDEQHVVIPILLKPSVYHGKVFEIFVSMLLKYVPDFKVQRVNVKQITDRAYDTLYPNNRRRQRVFSAAWYTYMTSAKCILLVFTSKNGTFLAFRQACLEARNFSKIHWTQNFVHSAENVKELDLFKFILDEFY
jgi:hypothetical protein